MSLPPSLNKEYLTLLNQIAICEHHQQFENHWLLPSETADTAVAMSG